ncbi:2,3-butanediol dehydrogenase [Actinomycetospora sp. TBRC 11914]|uniref:2,3-butanediol dehydrogenase n=1 Tax=Actinomycetospora sp. TBRC 11914 TaxID=2729387 RepID=UPI00145F3330|nr:2,3-butanediol dehydrogenase [Actinomycetospora sp. TBRC 11914]NMO93533.1 2,3-butanediol dehydrogenase [Actinomycetospora sp. TBRC 11914]
MRSAIYHHPHDIRIEDVETPEPGSGEVQLRVAHNGVCGSDLHEYFASETFVPVAPHPQTGIQAPVALGHEFSGTVTAMGAGVTSVREGDRVAVRPTYTCGTCPSCRAGHPNTCRILAFHGLSGPGGGLSEYTVLPETMVFALPEDVSLELGALVEPMAVSYHAVELSGIRPGELAVVAGLGPIGVGLFFALRSAGITDIIASDPSAQRRAILSRLGASTVIDPTVTEVATAAHEASDGLGARVVFDAAGVGAAILTGIGALAPQGKVVVVGIHEQPMELNPTALLLGEAQIVASLVYTDDDYRHVIDAMSRGGITGEGWVDHAPLDDLLTVYDELRRGERMKVLIDL